MVTPPVSDKDESQDNPPEQLEDKEIEKIESFLNKKQVGCTIKEALTIANACLEILFPGQEKIGLLLKEVSELELENRNLEDCIKEIKLKAKQLCSSVCTKTDFTERVSDGERDSDGFEEGVTGFSLDWSMQQCKIDNHWKNRMESLIIPNTPSNDEHIIEFEKETAETTMRMNLIATESRLLIGLITSEFQSFRRKNGRIAIWAQLPPSLAKFYCIGSIRKYNKKSRAAIIQVQESIDYMVCILICCCCLLCHCTSTLTLSIFIFIY